MCWYVMFLIFSLCDLKVVEKIDAMYNISSIDYACVEFLDLFEAKGWPVVEQ